MLEKSRPGRALAHFEPRLFLERKGAPAAAAGISVNVASWAPVTANVSLDSIRGRFQEIASHAEVGLSHTWITGSLIVEAGPQY
ncbi:MAG: hypothetical protein KF760_05900 [Candidatus Eremiobacteraeota bacterium]|nr:hypothetical protein [Candidatus Eremiobacteraeota bacterium]